MGHWRLKPPETAFRLRQPKTGGKEFTAMAVAAENASGTMVESTSAGATPIAAKLVPFLSHHSLNPIGSCYIFAF
uniref:Uncharacterized protein n=1 Tax=Salix viminalis TaxID=40686 RepID=A0A6N2LP23_SALVM